MASANCSSACIGVERMIRSPFFLHSSRGSLTSLGGGSPLPVEASIVVIDSFELKRSKPLPF